MSAREQAGLRGPVKVCVEEVLHPATTGPGESEIPERRDKTVQEFDPSGRLTCYRGGTGGAEWTNENKYDANGRFLKSISSSNGRVYQEIVYSYEPAGRLESYTSHGIHGKTTATCSYDNKGRKTVLLSFDAKVLEAGRQRTSAGSPLHAAQAGHGVPDGGKVQTFYDDEDRPIEARILGVDEQLISRVVCRYNEMGKLLEEKRVVESPEFMVPPSLRAQMLLSGGTLDQLKSQLNKFTGGANGQHVLSYSYDEKGRVTERRTQIAPFLKHVVTFTYNEQGDIAEERWLTSGQHGATTDESGNVVPNSPPAEPTMTTILYSYLYDDHVNWIAQSTTHPHRPDGELQSSSSRKRQLTYY